MEWCAQHLDQATESPRPRRGKPSRPDSYRTAKNARAKRPRDWRPGFLAALEEHVTVIEACRAAGVSRSNVYEERGRNESFATAWEEIEERTTERMEREALRRAVDGWTEREEFETNEAGERVATLRVRKFSDTLLIFLLKARRPHVYRERVEHSGPGGGPVDHRVRLDLSKLTDEQLQALEAIQPDASPEP